MSCRSCHWKTTDGESERSFRSRWASVVVFPPLALRARTRTRSTMRPRTVVARLINGVVRCRRSYDIDKCGERRWNDSTAAGGKGRRPAWRRVFALRRRSTPTLGSATFHRYGLRVHVRLALYVVLTLPAAVTTATLWTRIFFLFGSPPCRTVVRWLRYASIIIFLLPPHYSNIYNYKCSCLIFHRRHYY